jgi:hypothetical protein
VIAIQCETNDEQVRGEIAMHERAGIPTIGFAAMLAICGTLVTAAPGQAGVAGNAYQGVLTARTGRDFERVRCCIAFDASPAGSRFRITVPGALQPELGTYAETDLLFFSFWTGSDALGREYSGFSYMSFLNIFSVTSNLPEGNLNGITFITPGSDCPRVL